MRKSFIGLVAFAMTILAWGMEPATPQKPATKSNTAKKRAVPGKTGVAKSGIATRSGSKASNSRTASSRQAKPVPRTTWRNRQMSPSPERYKEIQEALVAKGYLSPQAAGGTWGESSADALKRFQADQNLESTGKINSLSLIALGLGPKRDPVPPVPPKPPAPPIQEAPAGR